MVTFMLTEVTVLEDVLPFVFLSSCFVQRLSVATLRRRRVGVVDARVETFHVV